MIILTCLTKAATRSPARASISPFPLCRMATTRAQPPWKQPSGQSPHPKLKIYNSLTRSKVPFVPVDPDGKKISWYACGPTVYDDAHLGHARNYVSTDVLRRILQDYFLFEVKFVMNTTDVDDKIILRGRQQHLLEEYVKAHPRVNDQVLKFATAAYEEYILRNLSLFPQNAIPPPVELEAASQKVYGHVIQGQPLEAGSKAGDKEAKVKMHINTVKSAAKMLSSDVSRVEATVFYAGVQDVLYPALDRDGKSKIRGNDHAIFTKLTKKFEDRFFRDMRELNVRDPNQLTRVTEFGKEIADFVDKIVKNEFGYSTADGSVYFDINAFEKAGNPYARLEPWNRTNTDLLADGEGALAQKTTEKRSPADFAIWKSSKPGEPSWPSTWGPGRPGWHIECSAMASAKLGQQMDIHSGGIDLAFPHHDNELAQSEAYWAGTPKKQWVNYFFHMGHLSIAGSKMSKSLKNFTTIRTALDRGDWTPRSLRIIFLLGGWRDGIEITDDLVQAGSGWEDRVDNFFLKVRDHTSTETKSGESTELASALKSAESEMYDALCDSFNTPKAMTIISRLVGDFNSAEKQSLSSSSIQAAGAWVTKMVNIFGLNGDAGPDSTELGWSGVDIPAVAKPFVLPLASIRDDLREAARSKDGVSQSLIAATLKHEVIEESDPSNPYAAVLQTFKSDAASVSASSTNLSKDILSLCDRIRDLDLWNLNIYLEDRDGQPALVRPVTASLAAARREKDDRARQKEIDKAKREREAQEKAEKGRLDPKEMFRTAEFGEWDENGLPVKLANGEELPKSKAKKLKKDWERQQKAHELWKQQQPGRG